MNIFKRIFNFAKTKIMDTVFPKHLKCIFCGDELEDLNHFDCCEKCFKSLPKIDEDCCVRCGDKMPELSSGVCENCHANNFSFDLARSVFVYDDKVRPVVYKLKYNSAKYLVEPLAYFLYTKLAEIGWKIDIVTSIPLHKNRVKARGYNQAKELALQMSKFADLPYKDLAVRGVDNPSQTSLTFSARKDNVKDIFSLNKEDAKGKNILIIDDIYTTGATVDEMAKLLRNRANKIYVLTLAHSHIKNKDNEKENV